MSSSSLVYLVLLCITIELLYVVHGDSHSMTMNLKGCRGKLDSLTAALNESTDDNLVNIIPNCLQYSDNNYTLSLAIFSYAHSNGSTGRYILRCTSGLLLLTESSHSFTENISMCYQCQDTNDPCVENTDCPTNCQICLQSECLHCTYARHDGNCLSTANCPNGGHPNPNNGNECECPGNYGGDNCDECLINQSHCNNTQLFVNSSCSCTSCPANYKQTLVDPYAKVPQSVIGSPGLGEDNSSHHKRATSHGGSSSAQTERTKCVASCPNDWKTDNGGICYACGITYCLKCKVENLHNVCEECRYGTLVNDSKCGGFYDVIRHQSLELEHHEDEERTKLDKEKLELKIILPILCFLAVVIFILFGVIAHFRYPHIGREKRHRDPKKKVTSTENTIENKFRPQSTVRFR